MLITCCQVSCDDANCSHWKLLYAHLDQRSPAPDFAGSRGAEEGWVSFIFYDLSLWVNCATIIRSRSTGFWQSRERKWTCLFKKNKNSHEKAESSSERRSHTRRADWVTSTVWHADSLSDSVQTQTPEFVWRERRLSRPPHPPSPCPRGVPTLNKCFLLFLSSPAATPLSVTYAPGWWTTKRLAAVYTRHTRHH